MEDGRAGKPGAVLGGMYAKAKQRVLNKYVTIFVISGRYALRVRRFVS